ncbi:MAG: hypothetical protein ACO1OG_12085 [Devosia sp.]
MSDLLAAQSSHGKRLAVDKSYLRGAIWVSALAVLVCLPAPASAQELSSADAAINNDVKFGTAGAPAPTEWLGTTPHFVMVGAFKDYTFDINVPAADGVADFQLSAKREYRAEGDKLAYIDFEIAVNLVTDGIERGFEFEFENADFATHTLPTTFTLQGEEFPEGALSNMELQIEWEWVEKSIIVNEEQLADGGALTIALEEGTAGDDGTAPNGLIGGFVTGTFEGKSVAISFTAPVAEAEIDD